MFRSVKNERAGIFNGFNGGILERSYRAMETMQAVHCYTERQAESNPSVPFTAETAHSWSRNELFKETRKGKREDENQIRSFQFSKVDSLDSLKEIFGEEP